MLLLLPVPVREGFTHHSSVYQSVSRINQKSCFYQISAGVQCVTDKNRIDFGSDH